MAHTFSATYQVLVLAGFISDLFTPLSGSRYVTLASSVYDFSPYLPNTQINQYYHS